MFGRKEMLGWKYMFGPKMCWVKHGGWNKILVQKIFGSTKCWGSEKFGSKKFGSKKMLNPKNVWVKKNVGQKIW